MKKSLGANTLAQPTPVWVVGSFDASGKANMMTIAWGGICCSKPPCVAVSVRKAPHTHAAILARGAFTVNVPSELHAREADYVGMVSGATTDKFAATGLTAVKSDLVDAPYVQEFPLVLECRLLQAVDLGLHTQFIGEIRDVKVDEALLGDDGHLDLEGLRPILFAMDPGSYFGIGELVGKAWSIGKGIEARS